MGELCVEGCWVGQQADCGVETVHDTDAMSLEFVAVDVFTVHTAEQGYGSGHVGEEAARGHRSFSG